MRDAAGEDTETLQLLCVPQLLFALLLVGHVNTYTHNPAGKTGRIGKDVPPAEHPTRLTAGVLVAELHLIRAAPLDGACDDLPRLRSIFRMNAAEECFLDAR